METTKYSIVQIAGQKVSNRRAVAFLCCDADAGIDAYGVFTELSGKSAKKDREVRERFDHWIDFGVNDRWFHGFPDPHKACITFKWKENRHNHRFYGFISNPRPLHAPRFQVCFLVYHDVKQREETDITILEKSMRLLRNSDVVTATIKAFKGTK